MNRIQEAVAEALGVTDQFRSYENRIAELEADKTQVQQSLSLAVEERDEQLSEIQRVYEAVVSDNRMLQRAFEDLDYLNLYDLSKIQDVLPNANKPETVRRLRQMRHENPLAKQGIRLIVRFTLGRGISWISKNEDIRDALMDFWEDEDNKVILTSHEAQKEFVDEVATDGEKFLACFEAPSAAPYLKLAEVPMEEVVDIIYDPDNRRIPVWYKRKFKELIYDGREERYKPARASAAQQDKVLFYRDYRVTDERLKEIKDRVRIPEAKIAKDPTGNPIKMMHHYVNPLWTKRGRRGISELFASREWFRVFREFMQDRAIINKAASAIAYKRKIKGGPAAVAQMTGKLGGIPVGQTDREVGELGTLSKPLSGGIYDSNEATDLDWMKTDTGAANAKEDGRMLLMVGGAGIGTNIHYFGEGGDANLATAQAMELPMVKNYEDWQTWFTSVNMATFDYVLHLAFGDNIPFEDRSTEAADDSSVVPGTRQLKLVPGSQNGNGNGNGDGFEQPARIEIKEPKKTTVWDVVSWDFPPIITKDVVKHMTAWAQLTNQVAPNDMIIKIEAIKGALTVLGVPNVDQIIEQIKVEEERLAAERAAQRQAMMDNLTNPDQQDNGPAPNVPGWTKAGSGADANTKRLAKGKPEGAKVGRVSASARPGVA